MYIFRNQVTTFFGFKIAQSHFLEDSSASMEMVQKHVQQGNVKVHFGNGKANGLMNELKRSCRNLTISAYLTKCVCIMCLLAAISHREQSQSLLGNNAAKNIVSLKYCPGGNVHNVFE